MTQHVPPPNPPARRSSRTAWIIGGVVVVVFAALVLIGNLTKDDSDASAASPASSSSAAPAAAPVSTIEAPVCYPPREISDPDLATFAAGLALPPGVQVITGRVSKDSDRPGEVGVALDLCVPGSSDPDSLRPIATSIAAALKPTALGDRTFALYVSDMSAEYKDEAKLKDGEYALHLWNGKPSAAAENARWEVVGR